MARDYYGLLGVSKGASDSEIKRAYRKLARELHPDVNPDEAAQARFKEISVAYEVLSDPEKRRIVDLGGDPLETAAAAGNGFGGFGGLGDVFEAFFGGGATSRGPIGRVRPGSDSLLRMRLDLAECATGVTKQVTVDTAVLCDLCQGKGTHGNSTPVACDTCGGRGEIQTVQRSLLGQVMTSRPCPGLRRRRRGHPRPVPPLRRRRPGARAPRDQRQDPRRRRRRHAGAAGRPGRGRARWRTGRRPVRRGPRTSPTTSSSATATTCTAPSRCRWSTRRWAPRSPSTRSSTARPRSPSRRAPSPGSVTTLRGHGMPHLRSGVRGDLHAHIEVVVPSRLDHQDIELLRKLKEHRTRDAAEVRSTQHVDAAAGCSAGCAKPSPAANAGMSRALFYVDALPEVGELAVVDGDEGFHAANVRRIRPGEQLDLERRRRRAGALRHRGCRQGPAVGAGAEPLDRPARGPGRHRRAGAAEVGSLRAGHRTGHRGRGGRVRRLAGIALRGPLGRAGRGRQGPAALAGGGPVGRPPVAARAHPAGHRRGVDAPSWRSASRDDVASGAVVLALHESATEPLTELPLAQADSLMLIVGPEGGIADDEIAALSTPGRRRCGWARRCCGPRPPRPSRWARWAC